ncbi:MAG: peroxide stress protein YaaA [Actinomycetes bacterium]|jgi:hypothetical protein
MKILLPPSEGKAASPKRGSALKLSSLCAPELNPTREKLIEALVKLAKGPSKKAITTLGLTPGLAVEIEKNAQLLTAPTLPVRQLYTGVLYDALDLSQLSKSARDRAELEILIFSALFGVVQLRDNIAPYRLSPATKLPRLGTLNAVWKAPLAQAMENLVGDEIVLDLRSTPYAALWKPTGDIARRTVSLRVLHETQPGKRTIVSHFNKATKGRIVASLLNQRSSPKSVSALTSALTKAGWDVESDDSGLKLDVIVRQL